MTKNTRIQNANPKFPCQLRARKLHTLRITQRGLAERTKCGNYAEFNSEIMCRRTVREKGGKLPHGLMARVLLIKL